MVVLKIWHPLSDGKCFAEITEILSQAVARIADRTASQQTI